MGGGHTFFVTHLGVGVGAGHVVKKYLSGDTEGDEGGDHKILVTQMKIYQTPPLT